MLSSLGLFPKDKQDNRRQSATLTPARITQCSNAFCDFFSFTMKSSALILWLVCHLVTVTNCQEAPIEGFVHMNPCHPGFVQGEPGSYDCEQIALPQGFCLDCRMNDYNGGGEFFDCTETMVLNKQCLGALQAYVDRNPCDTNRKKALETYLTSTDPDEVEVARYRLDWFAFSICEQGCDCIPQFNAEHESPAMDYARGNCQAHAYYHICRLLPNIKLVRMDDGTEDLDVSDLEHACTYVKEWTDTDEFLDWHNLPKATIHPVVERFLDGFMEAKQLLELDQFWNDCWNLEMAQNRIHTYGE